MLKVSECVILLSVALLLSTTSGKQYNFGFIHSEPNPLAILDVHALANSTLLNYGSIIASIQVFDALTNNLTLANISGLDAVFVWSDASFFDRVTLGDILSDFGDSGGGIVLGIYADSGWNPNIYYPAGRFVSDYLVLISPDSKFGGGDFPSLDPKRNYWPQHPVINGIHNITADGVPKNQNLTEGSYIVARYESGAILAAVKDNVGPGHINRVDLGLWPLDPFRYSSASESIPLYGQLDVYEQIIVQSLVYSISRNLENYLVVNTTACTMPNILSTLNSTFTIPSNVQFTQSIAQGTPVTAPTTVSYSLTVPNSGTITRTATITCPPSSGSSLRNTLLSPLFEFLSN